MLKIILVALLLVVIGAAATASASKKATHTEFYDLCVLAQQIGLDNCTHVPTTTSDGFIIDMIRFPNRGRPAVFLQHGLEDTAITWFALTSQSKNLATMLYAQGFDVFLGNSRGNHYSQANVDHPAMDSAIYFDLIDFDQMNRDTFACVAKILKITNRTSVSYVGHSQGTTSFFNAISSFEEPVNPQMQAEHEKIRAFIAQSVDVAILVAPVAHAGHVSSLVMRVLAALDFDKWVALFGFKWFLGSGVDWILRQVGDLVCPNWGDVCQDLLMVICGQDSPSSINVTTIERALQADPGATSVKNMQHWAQMIRHNKFAMYDYGSSAANTQHYGQPLPPVYNLSSITKNTAPPLVIVSGADDTLADPTDVANLLKTLAPGGAVVQNIGPLAGFAHLDFVWADSAHQVLYPQLISLIRTYMKN